MMIIRQGYWYRLLLAITILSRHIKAEKQKRQIFREQVLPALGGKIPEEAFKTDRLALNRLNKEGITVPDGIVLNARHVHKHPNFDQNKEIIKVYLTSDGQYVPLESRPHYNHLKTVDTTYIIRRPFMHTNYQTSNNFENIKLQSHSKPQIYSNYRQFIPIIPPAKPGIYKPIVTPLILPADLFHVSSWKMGYDWDTIYEPFDDYFVNNIALFNSNQENVLSLRLKLGPVSLIFKLGAVMPKNRCILPVLLLASILACSAIVQKQIPMDDYDEYQNFQPVVGFRRPIIVKEESKKEQDLNKIPGIPGVDYPIYHTVPRTSFSCAYVPIVPGMYANVETGCQAYHICHDGREGHQGASFLCTNGTLFNQHEFACDWWYNVNCANAPSLYRLNADPLKNPYVPKETKDELRRRLKIVVF
ncbi:uncharacterized protein LOC126855192 [Cataglyphis hispanica]|uniref:uncharacterized protein LOC126855192 n=1 Tax=Cataglyphis hispanica TaxID=1086592 RepID=UPI00217F966B|nr:uncharacterized protein LOC126855192 [Cataglyphis hispanica]